MFVRNVVSLARIESLRALRDPLTLVLFLLPVLALPTVLVGTSELESARQSYADRTVVALVVEDEDLRPAFHGDRFELSMSTEAVHIHRSEGRVEIRHSPSTSPLLLEPVREALVEHRESMLQHAVASAGLSPHVLEPWRVEEVEVGSRATSSALPLLGGGVTMMGVLIGGFYPVMAMFVVERERDTLETLLVSAASPTAIVVGRLVVCTGVAAGCGLSSAGALLLTLAHLAILRGDSFVFPDLWSLSFATLVLLSTSSLVVLLLTVSTIPTRSYKEAEWVTSFALVGLSMPLALGSLVLVSNATSPLSWIPITSAVVAFGQGLGGDLGAWEALWVCSLNIVCVTATSALLALTPGARGLVEGAWRPASVERCLGGAP